MKMNFNNSLKSTLALAICFITLQSIAQESSFKTIEKKIENNVPRSNLEQSRGWKHEHRWLNEFKTRVNPQGEFYDGAIFFREAQKVAEQKMQNKNKMAGWIPVGPTSPASASLTTGLGRINCIEFHPTDANTFWVGVAQGGVWKTTDSGQNWTPLTDDLPVMRISDISVDPSNTDIIYVCVGDYAYIDVSLSLDDRDRHSHYGMGVYKSTDGGLTWSATGLTYELLELDGSLMRRVFVNPTYSDSLVAAGTGGVWTSSDGGSNWIATNDSLIWDIEADPNDAYTLYAASGHLLNSQAGTAGMMKSTDFGDTWTWLNTGIPQDGSVLRVEVAVAPTNSNHVYALACNSQKGLYGIFSSTDAGVNWTMSNAGGKNILEWYDGFGSGGQGTYDLSLMVDPVNENKIITGGVNIWGSSDGGSTFDGVSLWYDGAGPGLHADQHQIKHNPLDNKFYVCNDGGLVRTSDIIIGSWDDANNVPGYSWPTNWEYVSDGMQTSSFYRIGLSEGNPGSYSAGAQDNSTYYNNAGSWSNLFGGDGMETMLHPTNSNVIFGSSQYGRILYSSNGGNGYNQMDGPGNEDSEWTTPFMYEPGNTNKVYGGFGNLYAATPGNDFTNQLSNFSIMPGASVTAPISHFNVAQSNTSTIYVAKRIYHSYNQLSELWVTNDGGLTWNNRTLGLPDSLYFNYIDIDNNDPLSAWVVTAGFEPTKHVYHTSNGGVTWENITYDLPNLPVSCIVHNDSSYYNTVYVGTDVGVYYSNDTLSVWLPYNDNLPNVIVSELEINYSENKMYAATFGRGVWKTDVLVETIPNDAGITDNELDNVIIGLYPNPNKGEFNLEINGFNGNYLSMEVVDIMGEVVFTESLLLSNGSCLKKMDFKLSNGMYFLKISHNKTMRTQRFIVD